MVTVRKINKGKGNKDISVMFGDELLVITYNRSQYTPKLERELNERMNENLPGAMLSEFLGSLIVGWDAVDVHEEDLSLAEVLEEKLGHLPTIDEYKEAGVKLVPVPLEAETFDSILSIEAQAAIVEALAADQRPNQTPSDFSDNT